MYIMTDKKDYYKKYLKYKTKYLELKDNLQFGGNKVITTDDNTNVFFETFKNKDDNKITNFDIIKLLNNAYKTNITEFIPNSDINGNAILIRVLYKPNNKLIGFGVITDLKQFEKYDNFEEKGGIRGACGLYITSIAGDSNYSGIVKLMFDKINDYAKDNNYDYLLLEAKKYEDNFLVRLYGRHGFISIKELEDGGEIGTLMCKDIKDGFGCYDKININQTGGGSYIVNDIKKIVNKIDGKFGILISIDNKIIFEKYVGNKRDTRFRIFSCSKPITGLAIMLLVQMKKLKLTDTIDKFCINVPYNDKITVLHLLQHSSGVYDFSSELYFKLNPRKMFDDILEENETQFVDFETTLIEINKNKPQFKPLKEPCMCDLKYYNNTGYDLLGYIIYVASGMKTDDFIRKNIFDKLKMNNSGFQHDRHKDESIPYDNNGKQGFKEQQNWFCGNAYVVATLRDYLKFLEGHEKLLKPNILKTYQKLYYFGMWGQLVHNNVKYKYITHEGGGDFNYLHSINKEEYIPLSRTVMGKYIGDKNVKIILSENHRKKNGFLTNNYENFNKIWDVIFPKNL